MHTDVEQARQVLAAHAGETERNSRPSPASRQAARRAGAFALTTPTAFGGRGASVSESVALLSALARGCPATAWVAAVSAAIKRLITPLLSPKARAGVFADPDVQMVETSRPGRAHRDGGGLIVSGRWPYATGCEDASWALLMVLVDGENRPSPVVVPTSALSIERTWDMAGLQGTGSHTLVADDVAVPDWATVELPIDAEVLGVPLLRSSLTIGAPVTGMARGALEVVAGALDRTPAFQATWGRMRDSPLARSSFVRASGLIDNADRRIRAIAGEVDLVPPEGAMDPAERARMRSEQVLAFGECRQAVDLLCDLHGSSGFARSNPLQRFWRDLAVGSRHGAFAPYVVDEHYGRLLVTDEPPILP